MDCITSYFQATIDTLMTFVMVAIILPVKYFTDFSEQVSVNVHVYVSKVTYKYEFVIFNILSTNNLS